MSSRLTKKSFVSVPGPIGEDAVRRAAVVGAEHAQAADEHRHLRRGQRQQVRPVEQQRLGRQLVARPRGSCGSRRPSARARRTTRRRSAPATRRCGPARTAPSTSWPASFAACSTAAQPPSTIRSASETCLPPAEPLNSCWISSSALEHRRELGRLVDGPVLLRREPDARAVGAAALVGAAEGRRRRPRRGDQLRDRTAPRRGSSPSARRSSRVADQLVVDRRARGPARAAAPGPTGRGSARPGPMSRCSQLVPRLGERVGELVRVLVEALRDLLVDRDRSAARGRSSASSARAASTGRARPGTVPCAAGSVGVHCCAPAGLFVSSHS